MSSVRFRKRILSGGLPAPAAPTLTAPASVTDDTTPTFTWVAVSFAATYDLQVATDAAFTALVIDETAIADVTYTPVAALDKDVFYARLRGVNASGVAGAWSTTLTFLVSNSFLALNATGNLLLQDSGRISYNG